MKPLKRTTLSSRLLLMGLTIVTLILGACQSGGSRGAPQKNEAPVVLSLRFIPEAPLQDNEIIVKVTAEDAEGEPLSFRYAWHINGQLRYTTQELPSGIIKRGDKVSVEVVPTDGQHEGSGFKSHILQIRNSPPEIVSIKVMPQPMVAGDPVQVDVEARDHEGDQIYFDYDWRINGHSVLHKSKARFVPKHIVRGDKVTVLVTPRDGFENGQSFESFSLENPNGSPTIISEPAVDFWNKTYTYQVKAIDPDNDRLRYSMKGRRTGMVFNRKSGLFKWEVPDHMHGEHIVMLRVHDSEGAGFAQKLKLDLDYLRANASQTAF